MKKKALFCSFLPDPAGFLRHRDPCIKKMSLISEFDILFKALRQLIFVHEKDLFTLPLWKSR